jgi:hypothetical protein
VYSIHAIGNNITLGSSKKLIKFDITAPQNKVEVPMKEWVLDIIDVSEGIVIAGLNSGYIEVVDTNNMKVLTTY